jgi:hypothetical protein
VRLFTLLLQLPNAVLLVPVPDEIKQATAAAVLDECGGSVTLCYV